MGLHISEETTSVPFCCWFAKKKKKKEKRGQRDTDSERERDTELHIITCLFVCEQLIFDYEQKDQLEYLMLYDPSWIASTSSTSPSIAGGKEGIIQG